CIVQSGMWVCAQVISARAHDTLDCGSWVDWLLNGRRRRIILSTNSYRPSGTRDLVFADPASRQLFEYIEKLAPSEVPVLITGETGTGKELVAQQLHQLSGRTGPFLAVNCGAISDHLAESELFGHEAGSFTGAAGKREGWFEAAHGGTLFLDEVGDLPLPMQ